MIELKAGQVWTRKGSSNAYFTEGNEYEIACRFDDYYFNSDDTGFNHYITDSWVNDNFNLIGGGDE